MENQILLFFASILTAIATENVVFTRALGLSKPVMFINRPKTGILYGALLTWIVTISSVFAGIANRLLAESGLATLLSAPLYCLFVCIVCFVTYHLTKAKAPRIFKLIQKPLPASTFNSALFGVFYITRNRSFAVFPTVGYALGAGIGYTIAIIIIYYARKRLAISPVPRSFRGLPILLLYIGFLSLAIYGLIGHGLPT